MLTINVYRTDVETLGKQRKALYYCSLFKILDWTREKLLSVTSNSASPLVLNHIVVSTSPAANLVQQKYL